MRFRALAAFHLRHRVDCRSLHCPQDIRAGGCRGVLRSRDRGALLATAAPASHRLEKPPIHAQITLSMRASAHPRSVCSLPPSCPPTRPFNDRIDVLELVFWTCFTLIFWCYAGYPLVMVARARVFPKPLRIGTADPIPSVSVVVAVRNGAGFIDRRLENLLAQEYPRERLEVIVVCNGCEDETLEIALDVQRRSDRIRVLSSPSDEGKAGALNLGVANATGEIIVCADVRQTFAPDAIRKLVAPFSDASVGGVTGRLVVSRAVDAAVEGMRMYWGLETVLRHAEGRTGSVIGATGAIYAIRRAAFEPIPPNTILDDVFVPIRIALNGSRIVMAPTAVAFDIPANGQHSEFLRKRRTMVGNLQLLRLVPKVVVPWRSPIAARFISHKLLRVLSPLCFVGMFISAGLLPGLGYQMMFVGLVAAYLLGGVGMATRIRALSIPAAFVLIHAAIFTAFVHFRQDAANVWVAATEPATGHS